MIDLAALRRNARTLLRALAGSELWAVVKATATATAAPTSRVRRSVRARPPCALPPCRRGSTCARSFRRRGSSSWARPAATARSRRHVTPPSSSSCRTNEIPAGVRVHLKLDTGMGRWGLSELEALAVRGRRADEPSRDRRHRCGLRGVADRPVPRRHRRVHASDAPHRGERGRSPLPVVPLRCRPLRDRALRPVAVRHRSGGRRARAGAVVDVAARAVPPAPRGREHRLRRRSSQSATPGSASSRRVRGRLPPRPDRCTGARGGRAPAGGGDDLHGCICGRARPRAAGRDAGRPDRSRDARRGSRPRRGHDHLRAHVRHRAIPRALGASSSMADGRFARFAERFAAHQDARAVELAAQVHSFVLATGDERAIDVGAAPARSPLRWLHTCARWSGSIRCRSFWSWRGSARRRTPSSSKATQRAWRSTTRRSTWRARSGPSITFDARSS